MVAEYTVKFNGKWYHAGEHFPESQIANGDSEQTESSELPFETPTYTKTEIMRMPVAQLRALAEQLGIEEATSLNGNELKEQLIALLYL